MQQKKKGRLQIQEGFRAWMDGRVVFNMTLFFLKYLMALVCGIVLRAREFGILHDEGMQHGIRGIRIIIVLRRPRRETIGFFGAGREAVRQLLP